MKPATEFKEISGRFEPINDMLLVCRNKARSGNDANLLALVEAVQAVSNELRDLERRMLAE